MSSNATGFGYFTNFGKTRRQGGEASISGRIGHFVLGANYTFIDATYQSPQTIDGAANSSNDSAAAGYPGVDDNIEIAPGNRIPQIPRNVGKAYVDIAFQEAFGAMSISEPSGVPTPAQREQPG